MGEQGVALHLAEPDAARALAALDRLARERIDRAGRPDLELVVDHVPQPLVVDEAEVDVGRKLLAGDARVHGLVAVVVVAGGNELLAKVLDRRVVVREPAKAGESDQLRSQLVRTKERDALEWRAVLGKAVHRARLAGHRLDQHADRHP